MSKDDDINAKEDDNMAMAMKPNEATIIKKGMLSSFLKTLNANKVSEDYWTECEASRTVFSSSDVEKMKKMCNGENN